MSRVAVTGAAGPVGRRVCALAAADPEVKEVVAIDRLPVEILGGADSERPPASRGGGEPAPIVTRQLRLRDDDLDAAFAGVDVVCHLAGSDPLEGNDVDHDLHTTARVLAAVARAGVGQVIVRTTAAVYGAWPDNPIPLTESAQLRPNPDSPWVRIRAAVEDRVASFAEEHPDVAVSVVRPCVTVSEHGPDGFGRVLAAARVVSPADDDVAPVQFVHADDVAAAIDLLRCRRAGGPFNVAPDGSMSAERVRALVGGSPRLQVPAWLAERLTQVGWRTQLVPTPPGFVPFVSHPWVVANDRLRAEGWEPTHTNDEAFVSGHAAAPWAQISPQRRQELALGAAVVGLVGALGTAGYALRRRLRR